MKQWYKYTVIQHCYRVLVRSKCHALYLKSLTKILPMVQMPKMMPKHSYLICAAVMQRWLCVAFNLKPMLTGRQLLSLQISVWILAAVLTECKHMWIDLNIELSPSSNWAFGLVHDSLQLDEETACPLHVSWGALLGNGWSSALCQHKAGGGQGQKGHKVVLTPTAMAQAGEH